METLTFFDQNKEIHAAFRRDLHAHPETAFNEFRTARLVAEKLVSYGLEVTTGVGRTGVVACYRNGDGPAIGLRADMDALDLQEMNDFDHKSSQPGKMHGCGHDGHTTMLLAAAEYIAAQKSITGTIYFIFQPAEENDGGATAMIEDGLFDRFPMQAIFGMHNFPGLPVGQFAVRTGPFLAAFETFDISLQGTGGHSALPHLAKDPIVAAGYLVSALQSVVSRALDPMKQAVLSITRLHGGSAYNIIPDRVEISGSLRYFEDEQQQLLRRRMKSICDGTGQSHDMTIQISFASKYPPLVNHGAETALAVRAMTRVAGTENVNRDIDAILGSEDFAFMLQKMPGCYMLIGNGIGGDGGCMVHNPHYDFNDRIIPVGASCWVRLCEQFCADAVPVKSPAK
ncbi:MAG: amidohydrolase [Alphaproteobacteria bacterium]|nr:amidohydrolase [Alphaproteobacteria bacterium]